MYAIRSYYEEPIEKRIASALIETTPESWSNARLEVARMGRIDAGHEPDVALDLASAPRERRREGKVVRSVGEPEDVVAVQPAHPLVREAGGEVRTTRAAMHAPEEGGDCSGRSGDVGAARESRVEALGVARNNFV